jgi:hypothetical protein
MSKGLSAMVFLLSPSLSGVTTPSKDMFSVVGPGDSQSLVVNWYQEERLPSSFLLLFVIWFFLALQKGCFADGGPRSLSYVV